VVGLLILALFTNLLTAFLGAATLATYLFLYTPLKRLTPWATIIGAIPGALPPVMGWTAAGKAVDLTALFIAAILFLWQVPHFLSLAWIYRRDYASAGYRLLIGKDQSGALTARECLAFMSALMLIIGLPCVTGFSGVIYMAGAFVVTGIFLATGWAHFLETSNRSARLMFIASLIYLPTLMGLMVIDRLLLPA
jgi:protoheme IX farnesyltransferase